MRINALLLHLPVGEVFFSYTEAKMKVLPGITIIEEKFSSPWASKINMFFKRLKHD